MIPHLYEEHGDDFVRRMEGNWAIGLWDERRSRLLLSRDRLGKKPLLWSNRGGVIRFASEAKAILADPSFSREPSMAGLLDVLTYGYVTETNTMFDGIEMVLPATTLVFEAGETTPSEQRYWDFAAVPPFSGCVEDAKEEFSEILSDVTRDRLLGDVPYGMMLSGGIDSTLVASFIVEHEPSLKTYTVTREDARRRVRRRGLDGRPHRVRPSRGRAGRHRPGGDRRTDPVDVRPAVLQRRVVRQLCRRAGDRRGADGRHHR